MPPAAARTVATASLLPSCLPVVLTSARLLCVCCVVCVCRLSTYPFDSIKSAMQSDAVEPSERRYSSTVECCRQLWVEGGWRRFYRGLAPCLLRSFPANAACFLAYERAKQMLG